MATSKTSKTKVLTKPLYWDEACRFLSKRDPTLRRIIKTHAGLHLTRRNDAFTTLARAIVGQQISVKAADAVWRRFTAALNLAVTSRRPFPRIDPQCLVDCDEETLRAAGLSQRKTVYVRDLARHFSEGLLKPRAWKSLSDEDLIAALTRVKGIGRWTAEMFLIFHECRPDVFPIADLGLQKAIRLAYRLGDDASTEAMIVLSERWQPYRSVATWYLWRSLDPVPVEY
ncbi:MAG: DNA-3-methyladenine glycosylase [Burkholderiales bacterium]|jgi:DNA-3-methyladenine glycosylase II|nr:DNA-3-methyladenine glycosylase [Burkholderiales bacterium]